MHAGFSRVSWRLLQLLQQSRRGHWPTAEALADGYDELSLSAPSRGGLGLANPRLGGKDLAVALVNASRAGHPPMLPGGGRLRLVESGIVLKQHRADLGTSVIDLLALLEDQCLAAASLLEDEATQAGLPTLIETLLGLAVLAANIANASTQAGAMLHCRVERLIPRGLVIGTEAGWHRLAMQGESDRLLELRDQVAACCGLDLRFLRLDDAYLPPGGKPPIPSVRGHLLLRDYPVEPPAARVARWPIMAPSDPAGFIVEQIQSSWRRDAAEDDAEPVPGPVVLAPPPGPALIANDNDRRRRQRLPRPRTPVDLNSSQALAQAVFAGLQAAGRLAALDGLLAEDGYPAFPTFGASSAPDDAAVTPLLVLRHPVLLPGEVEPNLIDLVLSARESVFVEVKLAEARFALCANPGLTPTHPFFKRDICTGAYRAQNARQSRCTLSEQGMRLWELIPELFDLDGARDHDPCPLFATYALVRRVLAVSIGPFGVIAPPAALARRHVLVVYDERNPAFWPGGEADEQWHETVRMLRWPRLLRRVSWQKLIGHLGAEPAVAELVNVVSEKYDFPVQVGNLANS